MNKIIILSIAVILQLSAFSQTAFELRTADGFYKKGEYYNAIVNYEIYLGIRKPLISFTPYSQKKNVIFSKADSAQRADGIISDSKLVTKSIAFKLAESYRALNHFQRSEKCYARLLQTPDTAYPFARYWYAVSLRCNNKFEEAKTELNTFIKENSGSAEKVSLATKELATLAYIKSQQSNDPKKLFTVKKLRGNIAQAEGAYAPILVQDTLIFTSARIVDTVNKYSKANQHVNHLFYNTIVNQDSISGKASMLRFPSRLSINEATATLTPDKRKLFFSRSFTQNGKSLIGIYVSDRTNDTTWSEPQKVGKVNKEGYNSIQPSVTQDGKYLLFASDRDGGSGGFDIWGAKLDANYIPDEPFNFVGLNTIEDEQAPYYHIFSKTLVFASKGYKGMGGFDIYAANGDFKTIKSPYNLGAPVNSPKDDIYFFSTSKDSLLKNAYISSDRASDCCLEIFSLSKRIIPKVYHHKIVGYVLDCDSATNTIENALVSIDKVAAPFTTTTNKYGYFFAGNGDSINGFSVSKDGYIPESQNISLSKAVLTHDVNDTFAICLKKIKPVIVTKTVDQVIDSINATIKPQNIYFDFDKSVVRNDAIPVLNEVVAILKKYPSISISLDINGYTDSKGSDAYNLKLGNARAEAAKQYIVDQGIDAGRMSLKSYGKTMPVAPNTTTDNQDNPEGRALNRRAEISIKAFKK